LVLVALDEAETPTWVPDGYIHFDLESYSVEQLIGVIKAESADTRGDTSHTYLSRRAATIERQRVFDAESIELLRAVPNPFDQVAEDLCNAIRAESAAIANKTGWDIDNGSSRPQKAARHVCGPPRKSAAAHRLFTPLGLDAVRRPTSVCYATCGGILRTTDNVRHAAISGDRGRDEVPHRKILKKDPSSSVAGNG